MMWIAFAIAFAVSVAALAFVVWPLLKPGPAPVLVEDDRLAELLGRKDAVLKAIKDLEFDYEVGKLTEEDFRIYDQRLRRQAVALLKQIEEVAPMSAGLDDALEAQIAQRRRVLEPASLPAAKTVIAVAAASPAVAKAPVGIAVAAEPGINGTAVGSNGAKFCTNCGNRLEPNHKFCANCGTPVAV